MLTNSVKSLSANEKCNFVNDHASYEPTKRRGSRFGQTVLRLQSSHGPCLR